jgi:hypothetical protein
MLQYQTLAPVLRNYILEFGERNERILFSQSDEIVTIEKIFKHAHQPLSIAYPNSWDYKITKLLIMARLPFHYTPQMVQIIAYREHYCLPLYSGLPLLHRIVIDTQIQNKRQIQRK